jgi:rhodanese-related sulfurtransferase
VQILVRLLTTFPHAVRAAALLAAALALSAAYNAVNPLGIPWLPSAGGRVGIPRAYESRLPEVNAAEAFALYQTEEAVFVDSRDREDYERDHIPGAINVPMREWAEVWPEMESQLPREGLLVLYCYGAHCGLSTRQGKRLLALGYSNLRVLDYGWSEWTKAEYPTLQHPSEGEG